MASQQQQKYTPESPWVMVAAGAGIGVLAGVLAGLGVSQEATPLLVLAYVIGAVAWIVSMVGVIGAGVLMGTRRADFLREAGR